MNMLPIVCTCPKLKCPRHGACGPCRAYHLNRKHPKAAALRTKARPNTRLVAKILGRALSLTMILESLRQELLAMREEDLRVRGELDAAGELGGSYVPRMEAVHVRNAARLRELIVLHGWPAEDMAGEDGARAAWFIAQHAVVEPEF